MTTRLHRLIQKAKDISFNGGEHTYTYEGIKAVCSVTQFIKLFFFEFDADSIIDRMMRSKSWSNSKYYGMSKQDIKDVWEESRDIESSLGTQMHENFEKYLKSEKYEETKELYSFINFLECNPDLEWQVSELRIFSKRYGLAGSIDAIFKNSKTGNYIILDYKRSKEIKYKSYDYGKEPINHIQDTNYWHYALQLNIYKYFLEKAGITIEEIALLHIDPKTYEYKYIPLLNLQKEVESMLEYSQNNHLLLKKTNNIHKD